MSNERANELILELIKELEIDAATNSESVDKARILQQSIADALNPAIDTSENTILDDAIALEASFAVQHPVAEKIIRELVNTLSRIGI